MGAVAINEINFCRLKAGMRAFSHLSSKRWFKTARVVMRAVATCEINFCRLKAGMLAFSHLSSKRRFKTARVEMRAVAFWEMTFYRLMAGIWYMKIIQSSNIKLNKADCFFNSNFFGWAADLAKSELIILPENHDLSPIWHCICMLSLRIYCRFLESKVLAVVHWQV